MGIGEIAFLALAGFGAGLIGSTAGLASLVSYPALLVVGLPPVTANVTNSVGLVGSSIGSVGGSRPELRGLGRLVLVGLPVAIAGGTLGGVLLLAGSPDSFEKVVPFLVALASVMLLLSPRVRAMGEGRRLSGHDGALGAGVTLLVFLACVYGGYFGAAAGVMILAVLLSRTDRPLPVSNAVKNVFLGAANASAAVVFAFRAPVEWAAVPALLVGCVLGGWIGPSVIRRVPEALVRWTFGIAGLLLAVRLGWVAFR